MKVKSWMRKAIVVYAWSTIAGRVCAVILGCLVSLLANALLARAEVVSSLDTAEETFFQTPSGTSAEADSSVDNFFDTAQQTPVSPDSGSSEVKPSTEESSTVIPSTPVQNTESMTNSNNTTTTSNTYYYYTTTTNTSNASPENTTTPEKSEQITLNGTGEAKETVTNVSLKRPQIATVISKKKAAVVALKTAVTGADGYQIQLCRSKNFKKNVIQLRTVLTTKTVKTNASGAFYVRVRAYKISSGKTIYSAWSQVKTVKIK